MPGAGQSRQVGSGHFVDEFHFRSDVGPQHALLAEAAQVTLCDAVERGTSFFRFFAKKSDDFGRFRNRLFGICILPAATGVPFGVALREIVADYAVAEIFPLLLAHSASGGNISSEIEVAALVGDAGSQAQAAHYRPFLQSFQVDHRSGYQRDGLILVI